MIIDHVRLLALANRIVTVGGSSPAEATLVAEHLVEATCAATIAMAWGCWSPMCATSRLVR